MINLSLSYNHFEGPISYNVYNGPSLRRLVLKNNMLEGEVNASAALWKVLEHLDLSVNQFDVSIHFSTFKFNFHNLLF